MIWIIETYPHSVDTLSTTCEQQFVGITEVMTSD